MAKPCIDNFKPSFLRLILAKVYVTLVVALPIAVTSAQEKKVDAIEDSLFSPEKEEIVAKPFLFPVETQNEFLSTTTLTN